MFSRRGSRAEDLPWQNEIARRTRDDQARKGITRQGV
jgi:hypothetical protein